MFLGVLQQATFDTPLFLCVVYKVQLSLSECPSCLSNIFLIASGACNYILHNKRSKFGSCFLQQIRVFLLSLSLKVSEDFNCSTLCFIIGKRLGLFGLYVVINVRRFSEFLFFSFRRFSCGWLSAF